MNKVIIAISALESKRNKMNIDDKNSGSLFCIGKRGKTASV